ncbi:MAG TPA: hypothetical protein DCS55_20625 [Acidimicrobiaceae bacterium]|nr:hypothetical protein [Acidimicrobiaceae bacterium]
MTGAEIAVVLGASLLGAFVKSVTGMGYPLLAVPLIALALGIEDAVVIVSGPNAVANFVLCWQARGGRSETRDLPVLVGTSFVGAFLGTFLLVTVPEDPLLVFLAATIVVFVVNYLRSPELRLQEATTHRWSPVVGSLAGVMQGALGVSGPLVGAWMHGYRLTAQAYVFSVTIIFGVAGSVQLVLLAASGRYTAERLGVSALALVPVLLMVPVGTRSRARLGGRGFDLAVLGVLLASGAALVVRVLA